MATDITWVRARTSQPEIVIDVEDSHGNQLDHGCIGLAIGNTVVIEGSAAELLQLVDRIVETIHDRQTADDA